MYFSTHKIAPAQRRDAWITAIAAQCGNFQFEFERLPFEASLDVRRVGRFRCARLMQNSKLTSRGTGDIDPAAPAIYFVMLQIGGNCDIEQFGRTAKMTPGDITILDSNAPLSFRYDRKNTQLSLHIPKEELDSRWNGWRDALATKLPLGQGPMLNSLICSAYHSGNILDSAQEQVIGDAIIGMLATGWARSGERAQTIDRDTGQAQLLRAVQDYVMGHLTDETLTPAAIAKENGLSERQLHRIFQASGQSVCQWIRQSRLDRCAADLRDPNKRDRSITQIAFRWGFNDSAHFSRVFNAAFGVPPSTYRASTAYA